MKSKLIISFILQLLANAMLYIQYYFIYAYILLYGIYLFIYVPFYISVFGPLTIFIVGFILLNQVKKKEKLHFTFVLPYFIFIISALVFWGILHTIVPFFTVFDGIVLIYLLLNIIFLAYLFGTNTNTPTKEVTSLKK